MGAASVMVVRLTLADLGFFLLLVVYKVALTFIYLNFVSEIFDYQNFSRELSLPKSILSWAIYLPLLPLLRPDYERASDFYLFTYFVLIVTPSIVLMEVGGKSVEFLVVTIFSFLVIKLVTSQRGLRFPLVRRGNAIALCLSTSLLTMCFINLFLSGGFGRLNFDLSEVYVLRNDTEDLYFSGIWGYLLPWAMKVCMPFLLAVALLKKRFFWSLFFIMLGVLAFSITGHRSVAVFFLVVLAVFFAREMNNKNLKILVFLGGFLFCTYVLQLLLDDLTISSIVFRRALFLPSFINYSYYEFFSKNDFVFYSNSVLSGLSTYSYDEIGIPYLIGSEVFNQTGMGANTGFLGSSYANGGVIGVGVISVLVGVVLKVFDSVCTKSNTWFYVSFTSISVLALLTSSAFFTSLLTQGVLVSLLLAYLYRVESPEVAYPTAAEAKLY